MECVETVIPLACFAAIVFIPMYRTIAITKDELKKYKDKERIENMKKQIVAEVKASMENSLQKERSYT